MRLIQIILPVHDEKDKAYPKKHYSRIEETLTKKFGGLTAYTRTPADGFWKDERNAARYDDVVILEVMTDKVEKRWWRKYKEQLEKTFAQTEIIIRLQKMKILC